MSVTEFGGVVAAVPTPFDDQGRIDTAAFVEHASWCLNNGCDGLNVLGTTGEANSLSFEQRSAVMMAAAEALDTKRLMVGTGTPDLETTIALTVLADRLGYAAALVLPPYYYKPASDDGLFAWFERLVRGTATSPIPIYLYNFPQMTGITFSPALVSRLAEAFPDRIKGAKDSSGELDYARQLAEIPNFAVFPSNEATLADAGADNYAGTISATVNIAPVLSAKLWKDQADAPLQDRVLRLRQAIAANPLIPAVKYLVAKRSGNPVWLNAAPPQPQLAAAHRSSLDLLAVEVHQPE
ncbi:dihydrodipicolinate synthase family protein [Ensifer sp. HO-A22]|uniref:Dihydrodipicolinate synthase family protein n=1 Tax=Ensifer oleiphilus TaxID=2742698 RepID=A0A7Y6QBG9_9HYPH|nr:dihydrodipicolinate synthase family protein [Ensifer oleiphilus]NVD42590.1 dihydrodipicolinate synthase family protein [Ensifer oleiphilus]